MFGGALFNYNGDVVIKYSHFISNEAEQAGGAIACGPKSNLVVVESMFDGNKAPNGLGNAIIWSAHRPANCANKTSACWANAAMLNINSGAP